MQKLKNKHQIMDRYVIDKIAAEEIAREAKENKNIALISLWATIIGTIIALIALLRM